MRSRSWMQSTGQTSTQDLSLMSMQGSAMMYVTRPTLAKRLPRRRQLLDKLSGALDQRRLHHDLGEPGRAPSAPAGRVGVVGVAEDRHVGVRVGDLLSVDPRDIDDHEVRTIRVI